MDIIKLRADTPCKNIYWNHASTSVPTLPVIDSINEYYKIVMRYGATSAKAEAIMEKRCQQGRAIIADLISAQADEIIFMPNGSMGLSMVIAGLPITENSNVVVDSLGFISNVAPFLRLKELYGLDVRCIGATPDGFIDLEALESNVDDHTIMISVTHSPNSLGVLQPLDAIGDIANRHNVLYMVDAANTIGIAPIDVRKIQCDFLSVSGRKYLRGPSGSGFLYGRRHVVKRITPCFATWNSGVWDWRPQDWDWSKNKYTPYEDISRFAYGERNYPAIFGLTRAVQYLNEIGGQEEVWKRSSALLQQLLEGLSRISDVTVYGPDNVQDRAGVIAINIKDVPVTAVARYLNENNVGVMSHSFFCPGVCQMFGIEGVARLSLHCWNTEEEVDYVLSLLQANSIKNMKE
jgi:cysteine desulfurase/selenocysteine lyase